MKRIIASVAVAAAVLSACGSPVEKNSRFADYVTVEIGKEETGLLDGISDNGKEVLNLYRFAAMEADKIYWQQAFGDRTAIDTLCDGAVKDYALVNYGAWDRLNGKAFIAGYSETMPEGLRFYPEDMTDREFLEFDDPDKFSPYTLIRRGEDGKLKCVWYHEAYAPNIEKICNYLRAAADITIVPSVREYLLAKAEALASDDYEGSECKWLEMDNSRMDLVIGPNESKDDHKYGIKRSYNAYVVLKDIKTTEYLSSIAAKMGELQAALPCSEEYKNGFTPGNSSNIFACDALYYAGGANAGIKDIAINLPFDSAVQAEIGTRTILMKNVISAKFNHIIFPLAQLMISEDDRELVDSDAFFWNVAFREVAHGLGVKTTTDGRDVSEALGNLALTIEEAKALALGVYFSSLMSNSLGTSNIVTRKNCFTTFLAAILRASRFGSKETVGTGNLICYNYIKEAGAISRHPDGCYYIDWNHAEEAIASLASELLEIQALGDYGKAKDFISRYSVIDKDLDADMHNLRLEQIPADIRFSFVW